MKRILLFLSLAISVTSCISAPSEKPRTRYDSALIYYCNFDEIRCYAWDAEVFMSVKSAGTLLDSVNVDDTSRLQNIYEHIAMKETYRIPDSIFFYLNAYAAAFLRYGPQCDTVYFGCYDRSPIQINDKFYRDSTLFFMLIDAIAEKDTEVKRYTDDLKAMIAKHN